jgi:two-component system, LuxR family, response regulator FixJ
VGDEGKQTVFVVDDDPGMRKSLGRLLQSVGLPFEAYDSATTFLAGHDPDRPGCLVLDVRMPEMSGLELQEQLTARRMSLPIIVVSGHADVSMAVRAMKLGSFDFIEKPCSPQQLLECIYKALALDRRTRTELRWRHSMKLRLHLLSARERQILALVVSGQTSKAIAKQLAVSVSTVDNHRANIMKKLGATTPADLTRIAVAADPDFLLPPAD